MSKPIEFYFGDFNYYKARCDDGSYLIFSADNQKSVELWLGDPNRKSTMACFYGCDPSSITQIDEVQAMQAPSYKLFIEKNGRLQVIKIGDLEAKLILLGKVQGDDENVLDRELVYLRCKKREGKDTFDYFFACQSPAALKRWLGISSANLMLKDFLGLEREFTRVTEEDVRGTENYGFFLKRDCKLGGFKNSDTVFVLGRKLE